MYDIIIAGAGPAGATAARLLAKNFKVLLLEKRKACDKSLIREKVCGGLLAPDAQHALGSLGLGIPLKVLEDPQLFGVRSIDLDAKLERYYQRFYININRNAFDNWLVSMIPSTVDIRFASTLKSFSEDTDSISVRFIHNGKIFTEKCRYLIGGDGALSRVRELLTGRSVHDLPSYIALQQWFKAEIPDPYFSVFFNNKLTDFYSWIIPKEDSFVLGAALPYNKSIQKSFSLLKSQCTGWGYSFNLLIKNESAWILRPSVSTVLSGKGRVALIGEAAGLISPSSAEGISYGLRSAKTLYDSFVTAAENPLESYSLNLKPLKKNILFKNMKSPFMYNRALRFAIMKSGIASMNFHKSGKEKQLNQLRGISTAINKKGEIL